MSTRTILAAATPLAAAIGVFGMVFGAAASAAMGAPLTIAMSLTVFSGTLQFAVLGLLEAGAGPAAILLIALALNARHLVLGAILRPRIRQSFLRRAGLAWFLIDESFGLAVAAREAAGRVLLLTGALCYAAWQVGTVLGVLGARLVAVEDVAAAIFPVLFIGLAAITARDRESIIRTAAAALLVAALTIFVPAAYAFLPIIGALIVALPGRRS